MYRLYGMVAAVILIAGMAARSAVDRAAHWKSAKAAVFMIERKCDIVETTKTSDGRTISARKYNDDCNSIDDWQKAKAKHDKSISAKATVKVSYTAPQDNSSQTSQLEFTSKDDEFYDLKSGDVVDILVSNEDPTKIRKD